MIFLFAAIVLASIVPATLAFSAGRDRRRRRAVARHRPYDQAGNPIFTEVIRTCYGRTPVDLREARNQ